MSQNAASFSQLGMDVFAEEDEDSSTESITDVNPYGNGTLTTNSQLDDN